MRTPTGHKKKSRILSDESAQELPLAQFEGFQNRPVNYFCGVVREKDVNEPLLNHEEIDLQIADRLEKQRTEFTQERESAYQKGFTDGEHKGREEGIEQIKPAVELLQDWVRMIQTEKEELIRRYEKDVVELAFQITEKILAREIQTQPEVIIDSVRAGLQKIVNAESVTLRVNPEDMKIIESVQEELSKELAKSESLHLQTDDSVSRGGCVLETENGILDGQLDTQLNRLRTLLAESPAEEDQK